MVYLLAGFSKITQAVIFPLGTVDLCFHSGRDTAAKHPDLRAFAHDGIPEEPVIAVAIPVMAGASGLKIIKYICVRA